MTSPYDRHLGAPSRGDVASAGRVNLGEIEAGDWIALRDGRLLEVVSRGDVWTFLDVRQPMTVDADEDELISMTQACLARMAASVARRSPRAV
jgi:hypothetical protein